MKRKRYLTTEELADELIRCIEKQTPEEKAEARKHLEKAFDPPVSLHAGVEIMIGGLARLPSSTKRWLRWWSVRN